MVPLCYRKGEAYCPCILYSQNRLLYCSVFHAFLAWLRARSARLELSSSPNFVALSWIFAFASLPLHASIPSSLPPSSSSDSARDTRLRSRRQIGVISTVIKTRRNPRSQELAAACSIATTAWKTRGGAGNRADNDTWPWVQQKHVKTEPRTVIRQWLI